MATLTKKTLAGFAAAGAMALVLSGCAGSSAEVAEEATDEPAETEETAEAPAQLDFLACAVSDEGSWEDASFNEAVYRGLQQAEEELGVEIRALESNTPEDFAPNVQATVDEGCDVIFGVGFALEEALKASAQENPDMVYVAVDGDNKVDGEPLPNVKSVRYAMFESSYLAGYTAAAYSTSKVIGTYGGVPIPPVTDFMDGYYYGAKAYEADTGTEVTVVGWDPVAATGDFIGDFAANSATSKSIAASLVEAGADVLFPVGGDQFGAASEAIADAGIDGVMVGVDLDIASTSPQYAPLVLTSAEKRMSVATFDIISDLSSGGEFSNETYLGNLANGGTDISPFYEFDSEISQKVKDRLAELKQGIIDGDVDPLS
jgi:basic membrane protein A and related proteins